MRPLQIRDFIFLAAILLAATALYLQAQGISWLLRARWAASTSGPLEAREGDTRRNTLAPQEESSAPLLRFVPTENLQRSTPQAPTSSACDDLEALVISDWGDDTLSLVSLRQGARTLMGRVGASFGRRTVAAIGTHPTTLLPTVWLSGAAPCHVSMHARSEMAETEPRSLGQETAHTTLIQRATQGVQALGENEYILDRALFEDLLREPTELARSAQATLVQNEGGEGGLRLHRLRRDSPLSLLGLRPGDVLVSINGHRLSDPQLLLKAYSGLVTANTFELQVQRKSLVRKIIVEVR